MAGISVIGLGGMGRAMARNLLAAGHDVTVWNRSAAPLDELVAAGARRAADVTDALQSPVVLSMLADDAAFAEVFLDSGVLSTARDDLVHANLATVSTALAVRATDAHAAHGLGYVAAPVFGRVSAAEAGALSILAAGGPERLDRLQPVFDVLGTRTWRLGEDPAQANVVKILGNYLIAAAIQNVGEAVSVVEAAGVDPGLFVELISTALFPGRVYAGYGEMIAERRYQPAAFRTELGRKDLHLALDAAAAHEIALPVGEVLREVFDSAIADGRGDDDWASIAERQPRGSSRPR